MTRMDGARTRAAQPVRPPSTTRAATWLSFVSSALFVLLTVLVLRGVTQPADAAVLQRFRPGDEWGEAQVRLAPWMSRLRPQHMYVLLGVTSVGVSLWRRSVWPLAFSFALATSSAVVTVAAKVVEHRPDPHGFVTESGGAFPSGHTMTLVVCLGGCLLVVWPRVRWWLWAPVMVAALLLGAALLVSGAHWLTDVVGGTFLALAFLTASSRTPLRRKAHRPVAVAVDVAVDAAVAVQSAVDRTGPTGPGTGP